MNGLYDAVERLVPDLDNARELERNFEHIGWKREYLQGLVQYKIGPIFLQGDGGSFMDQRLLNCNVLQFVF